MTNLRQTIRNTAQHNKVPATVIDVLGDACSVRLSSNGRVLRGIPFTGGPPSAGDSVLVDYASGEPVALIRGNAAAVSVQKTTLKNANVVTDLPPGQLQGSGGIVSGVYYSILRYPGAGGEASIYEYSATGLAAALTAAGASSGDLVLVFGADAIAGDFTVPASTTLMGLSKWDTIITGTVTMSDNSILQNLTVTDTTTDTNNAIAVVAPDGGGESFIIENCILLAACTSTGSAYSVYFGALADLSTANSYYYANSTSGTAARCFATATLGVDVVAFHCTYTNKLDITIGVDANFAITSTNASLRTYAGVWNDDAPQPANIEYQAGDRRPMYYVYEISTNTVIDNLDAFVICDTSGGAITVTLPAVDDQSRKITITNIGTNAITVDPPGAETINGNATLTILFQNSTAQLMSIAGGSDWRIV